MGVGVSELREGTASGGEWGVVLENLLFGWLLFGYCSSLFWFGWI